MKKTRIIVIFISFIALIAASVAVVFAWLVDIKTTDSITLKSGKVEYQFSGSTVTGFVVPGQNLVANQYQLVNNSTVDSQLRIKLSVFLDGEEIIYDGAEIDERVDIAFGLGADFVKGTGLDKFYYYGGVDGTVLSTNTTPIVIVSSIILDGQYVRNTYSGKIIQILITIQAKQKDFVTWETLATEGINFQTGT
ncbi:MAG: hypothetical protein ACOX56_01420 [Acholeplasmataceae bacterium]|jgi:TM2 domain-containing membrane protein YozV